METNRRLLLVTVLLGASLFIPSSPVAEVGGAFTEDQGDLPVSGDRLLKLPQIMPEYPAPAVSARAVLIRDSQSGITLMSKNATSTVPIASLTKLMTALVVYKQVPVTEIVEIFAEDVAVTPYRAGLVSGEQLTVKDLLSAMLIASANDATQVLARHTGGSIEGFVDMMNQQAQELGMKQTAFSNPVGFDDEGHFSTATDLALLVEEFLHFPELTELTEQTEAVISAIGSKRQHQLFTTNRLLARFAEVVGLKTGYTREAKGNLILLIREGGIQYYIIVLGSDDRERDGETLLHWVDEAVVWK